MPILDIEIVSDRAERVLGEMTQALADPMGAAFGADPGKVVARITHRPRENIHVEFQPAARGRIAFGGRLVE